MEDRKKIALWLYDKIKADNYVYQSTVVHEISEVFGEQFTYTNVNGNAAIDEGVLKEFRKLKGDEIVWDRQAFCWHLKTDEDRQLEQLVSELPKFEALDIELPEIDLPNIELD